jgi:hypothetical protein
MCKKSWMAALPLSLTAMAALADGSMSDVFSYSGLGTVGVVMTDTDQAQFVQTGQTSGATKGLDYGTDSKLALFDDKANVLNVAV